MEDSILHTIVVREGASEESGKYLRINERHHEGLVARLRGALVQNPRRLNVSPPQDEVFILCVDDVEGHQHVEDANKTSDIDEANAHFSALRLAMLYAEIRDSAIAIVDWDEVEESEESVSPAPGTVVNDSSSVDTAVVPGNRKTPEVKSPVLKQKPGESDFQYQLRVKNAEDYAITDSGSAAGAAVSRRLKGQ